jgi:hypothetical protein
VHPVDRPLRVLRLAALLAAALALHPPATFAQTSAPIELLRRSSSARSRARAAEALGRLRPVGARAALEGALDDRAPAVRIAAAQALEALGELAALPALDRHALDPHPRAREAVVRARQGLLRRPTMVLASGWTSAPSSSTSSSSATASASPVAAQAVDWRRVRVLITLGTLANNVTRDPNHVAHLREALRLAVSQDERYAIHPGALPAAAASRVRRGDLRTYSLEGSLTTLREAQTGVSLSVRAEVSLVLLLEPSHSIAATLAGSATAQDARPVLPNLPDPMPLLRRRAIEGAAHGALRSLETELLASR